MLNIMKTITSRMRIPARNPSLPDLSAEDAATVCAQDRSLKGVFVACGISTSSQTTAPVTRSPAVQIAGTNYLGCKAFWIARIRAVRLALGALFHLTSTK